MRGLASFVMAGRGQAVLVAAAFGLLSLLVPPASYLAAAAIGLVTLRHGWVEGVLIMAGAGVAAGLLAVLALGTPLPVLALLALLWLPVWILAEVLRRTSAEGAAVTAAGVLAALFILLVRALPGSPAQWWLSLLEQSLAPLFAEQGITLEPEVLQRLAEVMTGVVAAATVLGASLSLFIARWWQALLYNPGGFGREFRVLRTDRRLALGAAAVLVVLLAGQGELRRLGAELVLVALVVYSLQGLAVAHATLGPRRGGKGWLAGLYVGLVLLWPYPLLALGLTGLVDTWVDFRARWPASGGPPVESHKS